MKKSFIAFLVQTKKKRIFKLIPQSTQLVFYWWLIHASINTIQKKFLKHIDSQLLQGNMVDMLTHRNTIRYAFALLFLTGTFVFPINSFILNVHHIAIKVFLFFYSFILRGGIAMGRPTATNIRPCV